MVSAHDRRRAGLEWDVPSVGVRSGVAGTLSGVESGPERGARGNCGHVGPFGGVSLGVSAVEKSLSIREAPESVVRV